MFPDFKLSNFFLPHDLALPEVIGSVDEEAARKHIEIAKQMRAEGVEPEPVQPDIVYLDQLPEIDLWMEANCYDYTSVNPVTLKLDDPKKPPRLIQLQDYQRRILRHIFPPGGYSDGRISKYTTIIWSQVKKSGKTQIAANVGSYFAENIDPPNNVLAIANKKDQAEDRVYRSMKPTIKGLGGHVPTASTSKPVMFLTNGTQIRALPNSPATEAGDSYILTLWTEIWAFKTETDERLFAELMPVETQRVSMRWIETYAGYWDESIRLKRMYLQAFKDETERELQDGSNPDFPHRARYVAELDDIVTDDRPACVEIPEAETFIFWDHERRMPWQTDEKYRREFNQYPKTEAIRLFQNRWQSSSSEMLEEAWITAACVRERWLDRWENEELITLAVDAAMRHDSIALVGSFKSGETYITPFIEIFDPHGQDANLHDLVENRVKALFDEGRLRPYWDEKEERYVTPVYFDPFQLHQIRLNCIEHGIDVIEFNQGEMRKKSDTMLFNLYKDSLIINPPGREDFNEHLRAGKAKYGEGETIRIVKGTTMNAKRIDALVAQSMSCYGAFIADENAVSQDDNSSLLILGSTKSGWGFGETE